MAAADTTAWGQYLDERWTGQQWGLLGTSAASQILAMRDTSGDPYARDGSVAKARPILFSDREQPSPLLHQQIARGELGNIIRLASVAEALMLNRPVSVAISDWPPLVHSIIDLRKGNPWWSSESASLKHPIPAGGSPFVTAFVVHALRRYEHDACFNDARLWLVDHIGDRNIARRLDLLALIGLALLGRDSRSEHNAIQAGIERCQATVHRRRGRVRNVVVDRPIFHGYAVDGRTDYAFLNPEMLAALFLMRSGNPVPGRRFVLRTVSATTAHVASGKAFETDLGGEATVEQLWAARLLHEFHARANSSELRSTLRPRLFLSRLTAILLVLGVAGLGIGAIVWAGGDKVGGAIGVLVGAVFAVIGLALSGPDE